MKNGSTRLVIYSTLMTLGVVLMLLGISWLMFLGLALIMLAAFFSSKQQDGGRRLAGFLLYAGGAVAFLVWDLRDGDAFVQKSPPVWFWTALAVAWTWGIVSEFHWWRKNRSVT
jgi:hypothetical protein